MKIELKIETTEEHYAILRNYLMTAQEWGWLKILGIETLK